MAFVFRPTKTALARIPRRAARGLVTVYRYTLSPLIGFQCRHLPTCSAYADEALDRFGLWAGGWMTLARLCRCQPWGTSGLDVVPKELPAEFALVCSLALCALARHQSGFALVAKCDRSAAPIQGQAHLKWCRQGVQSRGAQAAPAIARWSCHAGTA